MMNVEWGKKRERGEKEERRRLMNQIEQEFVLARMEELEVRLQNNEEYWQQVRIANQAGKRFEDACNRGKGVMKAYSEYEDELSKTNCLYSEEAYKLGFEDGLMIGMEKEPDGRKSVLSIEDMTALVCIYDFLSKLKEDLSGKRSEYCEKSGVLGSLYDIIEHSVSAGIKLMGNDGCSEEIVTEILNKKETAELRAKKLLGIKG